MTGFHIVTEAAPLAVCNECAAVIVDDDEGANRAEHAAFHDRLRQAES